MVPVKYPSWAPVGLCQLHQDLTQASPASDEADLLALITNKEMEQVWGRLQKRVASRLHGHRLDPMMRLRLDRWAEDFADEACASKSAPKGFWRLTKKGARRAASDVSAAARRLRSRLRELDLHDLSISSLAYDDLHRSLDRGLGLRRSPDRARGDLPRLLRAASVEAKHSISVWAVLAWHRHGRLTLNGLLQEIEAYGRRGAQHYRPLKKPADKYADVVYFVRRMSDYTRAVYGSPLREVVATTARVLFGGRAEKLDAVRVSQILSRRSATKRAR